MKVFVLASGSTANALVIEAAGERLLVDCGLGPRTLATRLRSFGIPPESVGGVAITHEHSDHVHGLKKACAKWRWPVLTSAGTHAALAELGVRGSTGGGARRIVLPHAQAVAHGAFEVMGVRIPHDAAEPMAMVVTCRSSGARVAVATDIGEVSGTVLRAFEKVDALVLESNHDMGMLVRGPYPPHLKQRIAARTGHLSNADCGAALATLAHRGLSHIVLAHLSEVNNTPEVAQASAGVALRKAGWRGKLAIAAPDGLASGFAVGSHADAERQLGLALEA
ncbi:MAG: MBL fold metallo-hydrolase [Gemmatimonadetes bacterium]|nr:MBL fold metallo-hydrolase [Gemmatimonadota bacterium]